MRFPSPSVRRAARSLIRKAEIRLGISCASCAGYAKGKGGITGTTLERDTFRATLPPAFFRSISTSQRAGQSGKDGEEGDSPRARLLLNKEKRMKRVAKLGWMAVCVLLPANSSWGQGPCMPLSPYQQQNCNPPWAIPPALPQIGQTPVAPSTTEEAAGGAGTEGAGAAGAADQQAAESQAQATERGGEVAGNFDGPMF